jgi:hypothetical protein
MPNYSAPHLVRKNSQPPHTRISYSDKNIKKIEEKRLILFSQHFDFVEKIKEIVKSKKKK